MHTTSKIFAAAVFAAGASFSAAANADVLYNDYHDPGVWTAYDTDSETFGLKFLDNNSKDGFWLVVSDGSNPKGNEDNYAILYGDLQANRITAYRYDGANNANSFKAGSDAYLGTYENAFADAGVIEGYGEAVMLNLDVSSINGAIEDADWKGVQFGDQIGIWFHQSAGSEFTYGSDGQILDYVFNSQMYLDTSSDPTRVAARGSCDNFYLNACNATDINLAGGTSSGGTVGSSSGGGSVPAPGGLALILVGLAGLGRKFRKKA